MDSAGRIFLDYSTRKLRQLSGRIDDCLGRLTEEQIWMRGAESENAAGNLVLHLSGNVRQWIVSGVGGQPDTRQRHTEFDARGGLAVSELKARLRETIDEALAVLDSLPLERLTEPRLIQGYNVTVLEAIYAVVEHFSGHTGQIIYLTKGLTGQDTGYYRHLKTAHSAKTP
jgi:uncharacterized damage-inducible protein DinB